MEERVAIVAGSAQGLDEHVARRLAERDVVVTDSNADLGLAVVEDSSTSRQTARSWHRMGQFLKGIKYAYADNPIVVEATLDPPRH